MTAGTRTVKRTTLISVLAVVVSAVSCGSAAAQTYGRDNAVADYLKAHEALQQFTWEEMHRLEMFAGDPTNVEGIDALLERGRRAMELARRGANKEFFYELGMGTGGLNAQNPWYTRSLGLMAILHDAAAVRAFQRGSSLEATRHLETVYQLSSHLSQAQGSSESRGASRLFKMAEEAREWAWDNEMMAAEDARVLLSTMTAFEGSDPFRMLEGIAVAGDRQYAWFMEKLEAGDFAGLEKYLNIFQKDSPIDLNDLSADQVRDGIEFSRAVTDEALLILSTEDPKRAKDLLKDLAASIKDSEFAGFYPWVGQLENFAFSLEINAAMAETARDEISGFAKGEIKPEEVRNAALLYLQAGRLLPGVWSEDKDIPEGRTARLREMVKLAATPTADDPQGAGDENQDETLNEAQKMLELLGEAAGLSRCDFGAALHANFLAMRREVLPPHVAIMRALMAYLLEDVRRLLEEGDEIDPHAAAERAVVVFRMIRHLGHDDSILSSVVAHDALLDVMGILAGQESRGGFDEPDETRLREAISRLPAADPLGYLQSTTLTRRELGRYLVGLRVDDEQESARRRRFIREWGVPELMAVLIGIGETGNPNASQPGAWRKTTMVIIDSVPREAIESAAEAMGGPTAGGMLIAGRFENVPKAAAFLSLIQERSRSAREDVRLMRTLWDNHEERLVERGRGLEERGG